MVDVVLRYFFTSTNLDGSLQTGQNMQKYSRGGGEQRCGMGGECNRADSKCRG